MLILKKISMALLLTLILTLNGLAQQINTEYDFPIKPGMPEWKKFITHSEQVNSLQIPDSILSKMETGALVKTCLNYPLLIEVTAYNNRQQGIEIIINEFNGLRELIKRKDAGTILLTHLKELKPLNFAGQNPPFKTRKDLMQCEILLAQENILSNISKEERILVIKDGIQKFEMMLENASYDHFNYDPNTFLIGKVLIKEGNKTFENEKTANPELNMFLDSGSRASSKVINAIVNTAREHISRGGK
jgi:hypothetical protein